MIDCREQSVPCQVFTDAPDAEIRQHRPRILHVDVERFQHHLDGTDLSEAEKAEYLHIIWSILLEFMDLGYGVHPPQQSCGQEPGVETQSSAATSDLLPLGDQQQPNPNKTGDNPAESEES
ncbi:MAG: hypothetical protein AAGI13_03725 [Pseudomonadota bacterium]